MDLSEVYMVRSAKGNDMLCVDSYLYYYDDRGITTYRWSCNKRKDKAVPCRSRIITKIIDDDETKHAVTKIFGHHSHGQCAPEEISKAFERKRLANLAGKPCTLEAKSEKRRLNKMDGSEESPSKVAKKTVVKREHDSYFDGDGVEDEDSDDSDYERNHSVKIRKTESHGVATTNTIKIMMLKTSHGRDMICTEGYLYRLEGRADKQNTHRWECNRRREDGCKARVHTMRMQSGRHVLKQKHFEHTHPPYAQDKLDDLFKKSAAKMQSNSPLKITKIEPREPVENVEEFEEINLSHSSKMLQSMIVANSGKSEYDYKCDASLMNLIETTFEHQSDEEASNADPSRTDDNDASAKYISVEELEDEDDADDQEKEVDHSQDPLQGNQCTFKTDLDITQVCTLPSAKGNKMLAVDNYLYHFDSRSANKTRVYWTCVHRRDKIHNCNGRITTETGKEGELIIIRVSGQHMHANDIDKINKRLGNEFVAKAAKTSTNKKPREILKSSINELSGDIKDIVENSKDVMRQKISKYRWKLKQKANAIKKASSSFKKAKDEDDNESISSLSSAVLYSDDEEVQMPALPMKLEQMKEHIKCEEQEVTDTVFTDMSYDMVQYDDTEDVTKEEPFTTEIKDYVEEESVTHQETDSDNFETDMDLGKISTLRSAKGGELLCIDGFIYHVKSARDVRTYWECIKSKHKTIQCRNRVTTIMTSKGYVVKRITNRHSHPASKADLHKRLINGIATPRDMAKYSMDDLNDDEKVSLRRRISRARSKIRRTSVDTISIMKLYSVSDGPPSLAVRMTLHALKIPFELVNIDYCAGEHMTNEYAKINPQKEIPVLDDDGFFISESIAIMQYLCDKYSPHSTLYPKEASKRAVVNQRLCFNMGFYYASISAHAMAPIFFDYPRNEMSAKKVQNALEVFETYLKRSGTKYAAAEYLTIADFPLVTATLCLEAIQFDLTEYPVVRQWYQTFKKENSELWKIGYAGMKEIEEFNKNPPDLTNLNHPFHPARKVADA